MKIQNEHAKLHKQGRQIICNNGRVNRGKKSAFVFLLNANCDTVLSSKLLGTRSEQLEQRRINHASSGNAFRNSALLMTATRISNTVTSHVVKYFWFAERFHYSSELSSICTVSIGMFHNLGLRCQASPTLK